MSPDKLQFFNQRFLPGKLTVTETSWYLGFGEHDIYVLIQYRLLTPLGEPTQNCTKFFAIADLEKHRLDVRWYHRACALLTHHRRVINGRPIIPNPLIQDYIARKPKRRSTRRRRRPPPG